MFFFSSFPLFLFFCSLFLVPVVVMLPPWVFSFFPAPAPLLSSFSSSCSSSKSSSSSSSEISVKNRTLTKCRRRRHLKFCILSPFFLWEYIIYSPSQIYHIFSKKCLTLFEVRAIIHTSTRGRPQKEVLNYGNQEGTL